jgi:hypothetical protein
MMVMSNLIVHNIIDNLWESVVDRLILTQQQQQQRSSWRCYFVEDEEDWRRLQAMSKPDTGETTIAPPSVF